MTIRAILFDIGEVVTGEQWLGFDALERRTGRTLTGRGPLDPAGDPIWQRYLDGEISYTDYWARYAVANGYDDWRMLFRDLHLDGPATFVHPEAERLILEALDARIRVGALTNDGAGINGMSFFESVPLLARFDAFCDAQRFGGKPGREAYLGAARQLGVAPEEVIFLDDSTACIDGARAVGMQAVLVDPMNRGPAFDEVRRIAGLADSGAQALVETAEAAYRSQDLDRVMALFDPDISIHWNGVRVALGRDEARRFHTDRLQIGRLREFVLHKRLRAADGDTISVEYESSYRVDDGPPVRIVAAEFWTLRRGKLVEWRCYAQRLQE